MNHLKSLQLLIVLMEVILSSCQKKNPDSTPRFDPFIAGTPDPRLVISNAIGLTSRFMVFDPLEKNGELFCVYDVGFSPTDDVQEIELLTTNSLSNVEVAEAIDPKGKPNKINSFLGAFTSAFASAFTVGGGVALFKDFVDKVLPGKKLSEKTVVGISSAIAIATGIATYHVGISSYVDAKNEWVDAVSTNSETKYTGNEFNEIALRLKNKKTKNPECSLKNKENLKKYDILKGTVALKIEKK